MAEEIKAPEYEESLFNRFMKAGKVTVFESGLDRPDHIEERPFFNLLPEGKTSFVNLGEKPDQLYILTPEEQAKSPVLDTEAHQFFESMEKRFRSVAPGITLFIIDPDAVQGRYLMDESDDRSLGKSLYMHVEKKLRDANADNNKTFLTQDEILQSVSEAGITDRNPFSMRAAVSPSYDNLAGTHRVNLVVGDNPDAMEANVLDMVIGAEERRLKEGISRDEFRRLVLYHELGHATDATYCSGTHSMEKIAGTELDSVMDRHRTECIADAHAVLQLARDFGDTKCAALWGDCRIEYLRICVDRRLEDEKYDSDFVKKLNALAKKQAAINPNDPESENKYKQLMADKEAADVVKKLGSPLAYHTTDVIDATIKWAEEHLKDGSLQKMTDKEVIDQAKYMSETYGLTRQEMAEVSVALATGQKHPKYEQMMERVQVAREHMPVAKEELEKRYELDRELRAYMQEAQLAANLGLPAPEPNFSADLKKKLIAEQTEQKQNSAMAQSAVADYQEALFNKLDKGFSREEMLKVISEEKESLRTAGKIDNGSGKDKFASYKLKVVDAVIDQAPNVQTVLNAGKRVKEQLAEIKTSTEVSGNAAIVHFIKHELRVATAMEAALMKAYERDPAKLTMEEQIKALRSEKKEFSKALLSEKETQVAAFAIRSDKETWAKVSQEPVLAALVDQKAKQKPTASFAQYQMMAGTPDKSTVAALLEGTMEIHQYIAQAVSENRELTAAFAEKDPRTLSGLKRYMGSVKASEKKKELSPLGLKNFKIEKKKTPIKKTVMSPLDLKIKAAVKKDR